jgi:hypothetical protein
VPVKGNVDNVLLDIFLVTPSRAERFSISMRKITLLERNVSRKLKSFYERRRQRNDTDLHLLHERKAVSNAG